MTLERMPLTKWITSDPDGFWHLGLRHESRGSRTGKLLSVYYKTACNGKQLGGPWGQTEVDTLPANAGLCSRCKAFYESHHWPEPQNFSAVNTQKPQKETV